VPFMTVRHFTEADIPIRTELLRENKYQTNLNDFAMSADDRALADGMRRTIAEQHHTKRLFTMCGSKGQVVGFSWITSIDWRSQACELSFAVLPRYRSGFGFKAVEAAHEYLREQLHMDVIINQVLSHNTMMLSAAELEAAMAQDKPIRVRVRDLLTGFIDADLSDPERCGCFVANTAVELGLRDEESERVEIKNGLVKGDTLLIGAAQGISPGTPVRVSTPSDTPASKSN